MNDYKSVDIQGPPLGEPCSDGGPSDKELQAKIRYTAMGLLARREHSCRELRQKLSRRFPEIHLVDAVIDRLAAEKLQCDERFTEAFVAMRMRNGKGPVRIAMELRERGISDGLIATYLDRNDECWLEIAADIRERRFGAVPRDHKGRAKQMRFLQYRGFTSEQISAAFLR